MWQFYNVFKSLGVNRLGAFLVILQLFVATVALNNLFYICNDLKKYSHASPGVDYARLANVMVRPVKANSTYAQAQQDVVSMLEVPYVVAAGVMRWQPFSGNATLLKLNKTAEQGPTELIVRSCDVSPDGFKTLGLPLIAGRLFTAVDMNIYNSEADFPRVNAIIITKSLAEKLEGDPLLALNKNYFMSGRSVVVIGITEDWLGFSADGKEGKEFSVFVPAFTETESEIRYIIKVDSPSHLDAALVQIRSKLEANYKFLAFLAFAPLEQELYGFLFGVTKFFYLYTFLSVFLVAIIVFAVAGQTYFWVQKRRHTIGVRRAMGAQFSHVLAWFSLENIYLSLFSVVPGSLVAMWVNIQLVAFFSQGEAEAMQPISPITVFLIGLTLSLLSLICAIFPAMKAARTPPFAASSLH